MKTRASKKPHLLLPALAGATLWVACTTTGETYQEVSIAGWTMKSGTKWWVEGPQNTCGCIEWTDEDGEPLDAPPGEIRNGAGGGVVPPGAKGWKATLVPCKKFDGCGSRSLVTGPPGSWAPPDTVPGQRVRYLGALTTGFDDALAGNERSVVFDLWITGSSADQRDALWRALVLDPEQGPLPAGVEIAELTIAAPRFQGLPGPDTFLGIDLLAYDDQPLELFACQWNGHAAFASGPGDDVGNGTFRSTGFVHEAWVDQDWSGTTNVTSLSRRPEGEIDLDTDVITQWAPTK